MDGIFLGKISKVAFGLDSDGRFGLRLDLDMVGSGTTFYRGMWAGERSNYTKWTEEDRRKEWADLAEYLVDILAKAKKLEVKDLAGTPVEVTIDGNMLKSWRVLTEVL